MSQIEDISGKVRETSTDREHFTDIKNIEHTLKNIEETLERIGQTSCFAENNQWDYGRESRYREYKPRVQIVVCLFSLEISEEALFEKEVRRFQKKASVKTMLKKICIKFLIFILFITVWCLVILSRSQILLVIFGSLTAFMGFIYFILYRTQKFASNLR